MGRVTYDRDTAPLFGQRMSDGRGSSPIELRSSYTTTISSTIAHIFYRMPIRPWDRSLGCCPRFGLCQSQVFG